MAPMANAEQLGANRHAAGNPGARATRYVLRSVISARENRRGGGLSLVDGELEGSRELGGRLGIREGVRTRLRDDDQVGGRHDVVAPRAKNLAQDPLDAVSDHRVPDPLAYRDTEARARSASQPSDDHQVLAMASAPLALDSQELGAPTKTDCLRVAMQSGHGFTRAASAES